MHFFRAELVPGVGLGELLHILALRPHHEVVQLHRRNNLMEQAGRISAQFGRRGVPTIRRRSLADIRLGLCLGVEFANHLQARLEQPLAQGFGGGAFFEVRVLTEEFEVLAIVEDVEVLFVVTGAKQAGAQPRAASHHLPEFGLGTHHLEEHQVHHLGHVNAGVEHVHRDGDMRHLLLVGEVIDEALRVLGLVGHHPGEVTLVVRIVGVEALADEIGMVVVLGEDDGLAQAVAAGHLLSLGHQGGQHLVDGVLIEQPFVHGLGIHLVRGVAVFIPLQFVPARLLLFREVVVLDALALELQRHRDGHWRHQVTVCYRFVQAVGVGGYPVFQSEQAVGVVVNLVFGRGRQAHQEGVEVVEDGPVLLVDGAVRFVDDDEVEVAHAKAALGIRHLVYQTHHGRVGADVHPAIGVLLGHQVDGGRIGQVRLERLDRLVDQGHAVGQEQDALGPVAAHEHIGQGDDGAGLA